MPSIIPDPICPINISAAFRSLIFQDYAHSTQHAPIVPHAPSLPLFKQSQQATFFSSLHIMLHQASWLAGVAELLCAPLIVCGFFQFLVFWWVFLFIFLFFCLFGGVFCCFYLFVFYNRKMHDEKYVCLCTIAYWEILLSYCGGFILKSLRKMDLKN